MKKELNSVGRYLFALRTQEGPPKIGDYLRKHKLPISDNYYRDIESGRKQLSLEKAIELTRYLPLGPDGREEFIWHFLRDVLPEDIEKKLLLPRVDKSFASAKEAIELLQRDIQLYRRAEAIRQFEENFVSDESVYGLLVDNIEMLPILHFIYMTDSASELQIKTICEKEKISFDLDKIIEIMSECGVIVTKDSKDSFTFKRAKPVFRVTNTLNGRRLKRKFTDLELEKSRRKPIASQLFDSADGFFETSVIISVSDQRATILRERLHDFLTETALAKDPLEKSNAQPFFVMCVVSSRPEYNP